MPPPAGPTWFALLTIMFAGLLPAAPAHAAPPDEARASSAVDQPNGSTDSDVNRTSSDADDDSACPRESRIPPDTSPEQFTLMGVACFKSGDHARAYTYYRRAYDAAPRPLLTAAIGRTLHRLGIYHLAGQYYRRFLESDAAETGQSAASADKIRSRLDQLERDIERDGRNLRITSVPSSAAISVTLDNGEWVSLGRTPTAVVLAPDTYRFAIHHPNHRGRVRTVDLQSDSAPESVDITLFHREAGFDKTAASWKRGGFIVSAASVPLFATAGLLFGLSHNAVRDADRIELTDADAERRRNKMVLRAGRMRGWAIATTAVGATALGVGASMMLRGGSLTPERAYQSNAPPSSSDATSEPSTSRQTPGLRLMPIVGPGGGGIRLEW